MTFGVQTEHGSSVWGGAPPTLYQRGRGARAAIGRPIVTQSVDPIDDLAINVQGRLDHHIRVSLEQAITELLHHTPTADLDDGLDRFYEQTSRAWELLVQSHNASVRDDPDPDLDLVKLARTAHDRFPKEAGRVYIRAAIYLNAGALALEGDGELPTVGRSWQFLAKHWMLFVAYTIASESLKISAASTEAVAKHLWRYWARHVQEVAGGLPAQVDRLFEESYLKAAADESEFEDDGEPEIWQPRKVASGGYA